jgi:hypothetical protein
MIQAIVAIAYLIFWAVIILGSMYLTGTWYPLFLLVFLITFTVDFGVDKNENTIHSNE